MTQTEYFLQWNTKIFFSKSGSRKLKLKLCSSLYFWKNISFANLVPTNAKWLLTFPMLIGLLNNWIFRFVKFVSDIGCSLGCKMTKTFPSPKNSEGKTNKLLFFQNWGDWCHCSFGKSEKNTLQSDSTSTTSSWITPQNPVASSDPAFQKINKEPNFSKVIEYSFKKSIYKKRRDKIPYNFKRHHFC